MTQNPFSTPKNRENPQISSKPSRKILKIGWLIMGSAIGKLCNPFPTPKVTILLVGPKEAGKTTFLYASRLKPGWSEGDIKPTLGYNYETFSTDRAELGIWDVSGEEFLNPLTRALYRNIKFTAVIFVVQLKVDTKYLIDAKRQLLGLMNEEPLKSCALALVFNRRNDQQTQKDEFLAEAFALSELTHIPAERKKVFVVNARAGGQSDDVYEWLGSLSLREIAK